MTPRRASRLAWSIGTFSIVLMVGALVLMFIDRHAAFPVVSGPTGSGRWTFANVLNAVVNLAVPTFGVILASRRPANTIGWLFLAAGFTLGLSGFATSYALHALVADPGSLLAGRAFAWVGSWVGLIPLGLLAFIFLLFPTGHLRSRRWRPVAWFVGGDYALLTVALLVFSTLAWKDPFGQQSSSGGPGIGLVFVLLFVLPLLAALTAVIMRFRGSAGDERLQLKWFVTAAALVVAMFVWSFFSSSCNSCNPPALVSVLQSLAFVFLWTAIAVAVLKYRLYEIDVVISKAVIYGALAVFITLVYVGLVIGVGTLVGHRGSPLLSAIAAAVIAVAFQPVRERSRRLANRVVYGKRATPYEVLSEFSERVGDTYAAEDLLPRMARILGEGTAATRAEVWVRVGSEIRRSASWPEDGEPISALGIADGSLPDIPDAGRAVEVRDGGELLGALAVTKPRGDPLTATEDKLLSDLASQAGLVLRNVRLIEELRASRQRLVTAQDEARRRLERNIHDGAQQQLVAIAVKQRLMESLVRSDPDKAVGLLSQLQTETSEALEDLRELARGIYPPLLADKGLATAIEGQARRAPLPVFVEAEGISRYRADAEAAVYFSVLEGLQNVAKYAGATRATVRLGQSNGELTFEVADDGDGFDAAARTYGTGLQGIADRLAALDGTLEVRSKPGVGTTLCGRVPL